jgi:hypothetical protein
VDAALDRYIEEPIIIGLHRLLPGLLLEPFVAKDTSGAYLNLPVPRGADYAIKLWLQPEWQIHAEIITTDESVPAFWYMPFEDTGFKDSNKRDEALLATLELIVLHKTRIIQDRGFLFHSFRCEYETNDAWGKVYNMGYFRFGNFNTPRIAGRKHIYHSPAIAASFDSVAQAGVLPPTRKPLISAVDSN